jgi:transposase
MSGALASLHSGANIWSTFREQLATAPTGDGRPLAVACRTRLEHEWAHLEASEARLAALTAARDDHIATGTDRVATVARQLCTLRAVAETSAAVFSAELFGTRTFNNGRELGALLGLVPVPSRRDQAVRDHGISKAGRAELRRMWLQIAWGWLRGPPHRALTPWFQRRFGAAGGRSTRIGMVALARTLAIARPGEM